MQKFFDTVLENKPKPTETLSMKKALLSDPALNLVRSQSILFLSQSSHWTFGGQCCHPGCHLFRERKEHSCQMASSFYQICNGDRQHVTWAARKEARRGQEI